MEVELFTQNWSKFEQIFTKYKKLSKTEKNYAKKQRKSVEIFAKLRDK